jgi:hypothetical protein
MSKKIFNSLSAISQRIPPAYRYEMRVKAGSEILAKNPKAEFEGKPLDPKKNYRVKAAVQVNHYQALKKIFREKGLSGVKAYEESFHVKAERKGENHIN